MTVDTTCVQDLYQSESSNRSTGRKRTVVNYREQGFQDSGHDSDYEATLKPLQPLDNKSYPSASRIATQHLIETNKANKQTKWQNDGSLPVAMEPLQKSAHIGNSNAENRTLTDATEKSSILMIPDKTPETSPVGVDATSQQSNAVLPDATNSKSIPPDETEIKDNNAALVEPNDEKPSRGVFKTKTITICRSKDPRNLNVVCVVPEHLPCTN